MNEAGEEGLGARHASDEAGVEAVIFDLGRVLVQVDVRRGLFHRVVDLLEADPEDVMERLKADPLFQEFNRGVLSPRAFHAAIAKATGLEIGFDDFARLWCDLFAPMPGMEALLGEVADRATVGLLSDTDPLHWAHIAGAYPWIGAIARPTLSYEVGALKPDPVIYRAAARAVGRPPARCLFVDDLPGNVAGARAVGMQAIRFTDAATLRPALAALGLCAPGPVSVA